MVETRDSGGQTRRVVRSDGHGETVEETRDRNGNVIERTITNRRKGAEDVEVYDGNNRKVREEEVRRDWSRDGATTTTYTSDRRVTEFRDDGTTVSKITTSHTVRTFDSATGKTEEVTTFETDDVWLGGHTKGTTKSDGITSATDSHTDWTDGSSVDFRGSRTGGHSESHQTSKDDQGNTTGSAHESQDTWRDQDGQHTNTSIDTSSGGDTTHKDTQHVDHDDGSSDTTWQQTTTGSKNSDQRGSSVTDTAGNTSTSSSTTDHDTGNTTTTTTTTDKDGNGTEHTTVTDSEGNVISDETKNVSKDPDTGYQDPEGGTDEGPHKPTHHVGKTLDELEWQGKKFGSGDGDFGEEESPLVTGELARHLKEVVVSVANGDDWGEGPQTKAYIDIEIDAPPGAVDDWGDLNNPRALVAKSDGLRAVAYASYSGAQLDVVATLDVALSSPLDK